MMSMSHESSRLVESIYVSTVVAASLIMTPATLAQTSDDGSPPRWANSGGARVGQTERAIELRHIPIEASIFDGLQAPTANTGATNSQPAQTPLNEQSDQANAPQAHTGRSALEFLTSLTPTQRTNSHIQIEPLNSASPAEVAAGNEAENLWNAGDYNAALQHLVAIQQRASVSGRLAVGVSWLNPEDMEGGIAGFGDTTIGANDAVGSIALDVNKANGNLYCIVQNADGWRLYRSTNSGATWANTYSWTIAGGVQDVDMAIVNGLVYIGYVAEGDAAGDLTDLRVRRASAATGAIDAAYGFVLAYDAAPATIEEIAAVSNADDGNTNIFFATLLSDDSVGYQWDQATDGNTWTDIPTGYVNAESGLDATLNPDGGAFFFFISYVGTDDTIKVARRESGIGWDNFTVEPAYTGVIGHTAISAWQDLVLVGYRHSAANGYGLRYRITYDAGETAVWPTADIFVSSAGVLDNLVSFDVTARGGFGTAAVCVIEKGDIDEVLFRKRDGYVNSSWDAVGSSRVDLQACKLEYSIVSPK